MRPITTFNPLSACALVVTLLVAACGGGDPSPPPSVPGSTGFVVDDYLSGATVMCDTNGNGKLDTGELSVTTDSSGFFKFSPACTATIVVTGGVNIDTKLPFTGTLKAPAGSTVVTPLTTLMAEGMTNDQVIAALGLPPGNDLKNVDPARKLAGQLVNPDLMRKTLVLQQIIQKTTETLAGLAATGGDAAKASIYSEVAAAVAATLKNTTALSSSTSSSSDAITAVVTAAVQRVAASTTLPGSITGGVKSVNAASVAQVIAGSLKAQSDAILKSSEANLTATTKAAQSDTQVATFVKTNATALAGAPGTATGTLATTLTATTTQSLSGGGTTPTTPTAPAVDGTLIASFDESTPLVVLGFEGADGSYIDDVPPAGGGTAKALHIVRSGTVVFAGVVVTVPTIPFAANRKTITARVYSPKAGIPFVLKTEYSQGNGTGEAQATTAVVQGWQTLSWVMSDADISKAYTRLVILPQLGTATGNGIADNYFVDNVVLASAPVVAPSVGAEASCATTALQCIGFAESTIGTDSFGGLSAVVASDPVASASNKVLKINKGPPNEPWAGTTVFTSAAAKSIDRVGLATSKSVTMRSYSGAAVGTKITLKFENSVDPNKYLIAQAVTTSQNAWETLTFNFANPTNGVFDAATVYDKASILPAWSEVANTQPALTAITTFYFDELKYAVSAASSGGGGGSVPTTAPTTTIPSGALVIYSEAAAVANFNPFPNWGQPTQFSEVTIASNKSLKYTGLTYEGITWEQNPVDVSAKTKLHLDLWSPDLASVKISIIGSGENAVTQALTAGSWNSVDIDLSQYTVPNKSAIIQIKLESVGAPGTLYVDNIYFWGSNAPVSCGTIAPTCAPTTTIPGDALTIYSETTAVANFNPFPNWGQPTQYSEATIASNKSLKYTGLTYEGITWEQSPINVSAKGKLHLDLWSPDLAGVKVSIIGGGENAVTVPLTAGRWNSVDIDMSQYTVPNKSAIIQIKLESTNAPGTLYVDNIYFWGTATAGSGGSGAYNANAVMGSGGAQTMVVSTGDSKGIFASGEGIFAFDYKGALDSSNNYASYSAGRSDGTPGGGNIGYYNDSLMSTSSQKLEEGGWIVGTSLDAGGTPNFFRYFVMNPPASTFASSYMGLYANAPNNGTLNASSYSSLKFRLWGPASMYEQSNFNPTLEVVLSGPKVDGCATSTGGTEIFKTFQANQKIGAGSAYKLAFSGFTVRGVCGTDTTGTAIAAVTAKLARMSVTVPASSFNFTNKNSDGVSYSIGVNVGPIGFTNN